jgi:hypothetical protein
MGLVDMLVPALSKVEAAMTKMAEYRGTAPLSIAAMMAALA